MHDTEQSDQPSNVTFAGVGVLMVLCCAVAPAAIGAVAGSAIVNAQTISEPLNSRCIGYLPYCCVGNLDPFFDGSYIAEPTSRQSHLCLVKKSRFCVGWCVGRPPHCAPKR